MDGPERLDAVERRLARLEEAQAASMKPVPAATPVAAGSAVGLPATKAGGWWLLEHLAARPHEREGVGGTVAYGGTTSTPGVGEVAWQAEHYVADLLEIDVGPAAPVFAALGHPVRLEILRRLLLGARTLADLQQIPGTGTTGQIHHHLRELRSAGLVVAARNDFSVVAERVVPVLVALAAAAGPGAIPATGK